MKLIADIHNAANVPKNGKGSNIKIFSQEKDIVSTTCLPNSTPPPQNNVPSEL